MGKIKNAFGLATILTSTFLFSFGVTSTVRDYTVNKPTEVKYEYILGRSNPMKDKQYLTFLDKKGDKTFLGAALEEKYGEGIYDTSNRTIVATEDLSKDVLFKEYARISKELEDLQSVADKYKNLQNMKNYASSLEEWVDGSYPRRISRLNISDIAKNELLDTYFQNKERKFVEAREVLGEDNFGLFMKYHNLKLSVVPSSLFLGLVAFLGSAFLVKDGKLRLGSDVREMI